MNQMRKFINIIENAPNEYSFKTEIENPYYDPADESSDEIVSVMVYFVIEGVNAPATEFEPPEYEEYVITRIIDIDNEREIEIKKLPEKTLNMLEDMAVYHYKKMKNSFYE